MSILSEIFCWWHGNTWGTRWTLRSASRVGTDSYGNTYYEQRRPRRLADTPAGRPRRYVVYRDYAEASQVPAEWHAWLHYMTDTLPMDEAYTPKPWQKGHKANMTGTADAYRPSGSILGGGVRPKATGDYTPWRPS
jgi:NADH:ubiquinone oxidoreductase subunit